jgi:O-antigen/teichoic acid export membrane protein
MPPARYGEYTIAYSCLMLLTAVHSAVLVEPVNVIGAKEFGSNRVGYLRSAELLHCLSWLVFAGIGLAVIAVLKSLNVGGTAAIATMMVASLPILLASVWRRGCYMGDDQRRAVLGSIGYLAVVTVGVFFAHRIDSTSAGGPFVVMSVASLATLALTRYKASADDERIALRSVAERHWQYGRWVAVSGALVWLAEMAYPVLIGINLGSEQAGAFRATELLMMPLYQGLIALTLPIQPWLSRRVAATGALSLRPFVWTAGLCITVVSTSYAALLARAGQTLVGKLYPAGLAAAVIATVLPLGAWLVLRCVHDVVLIPCLRAMERTRVIFLASLVGAMITICFGTVVVSRWGLAGAATARASGTLVQLGVLYAGYRWTPRETP